MGHSPDRINARPSSPLGRVEPDIADSGVLVGYGKLPVRWKHTAEIRVGGLADLVPSKELLRRAKDVEHLAVLYEQFPELATHSQQRPPEPT